MLGTIRKDAPIETDPAAYIRQSGDPAAAAQLLATLEMHKMVDRWGLEEGGTAAAARGRCSAGRQWSRPPCRCWWRAACLWPKTPTAAGTPCRAQDVYLPDADRLAALLDSDAEIWAFDAKPLYRLALEQAAYRQSAAF